METVELIPAIVGGVAVLALLLGRSRAEYSKGFKMFLGWMVILAVVFTGVVYTDDIKNSRLYTSLVAGSAQVNEDGSMVFTRSSDGHFHIDASVNDVPLRFMVDTGASEISLSMADAERIGFNKNNLRFDKLYRTANGSTRGASVRLKNIKIGNYQTGEISASVNEGELDTSLLGLSFLNRMKTYRVEGDRLILIP